MGVHLNMQMFEDVAWADVTHGDTVYLRGTCEGDPCVYGPHTVLDPVRRRLVNKNGTGFYHLSEELTRRVCLTPGAHYTTEVTPTAFAVKVETPANATIPLTEKEATNLAERLHDAVEGVLSQYWRRLEADK